MDPSESIKTGGPDRGYDGDRVGSGRGDQALIVDGVAVGREAVARELVDAGYTPLFASHGGEALDYCRIERVDLIVAAHRPPSLDAIEFVRRLRVISDVPVVVVTSCGSVVECERAMRIGADRFLQFEDHVTGLGQLARDLVATNSMRSNPREALTTEQARALRRRELQRLLQQLVVECRGNIAEIARRMGRDRSTVRYHLRRMGMLD